jgi:hypothetical protein
MTNKEFSETNEDFKAACAAVKLPKSGNPCGLSRQAGKWRRKTGLAYTKGRS